MQGVIEHYTEEFPKVAKYNGPVVLITLAAGIGFFYRAYQAVKHDETKKRIVLLQAAAFYSVALVAKVTDFGFPYDDPADQLEALKSSTYNNHHMVIHIFVFLMLNSTVRTIHGSQIQAMHVQKKTKTGTNGKNKKKA